MGDSRRCLLCDAKLLPGLRTVGASTAIHNKETEAESVAFVVGKAAGLTMGNASASYIQLYHGNASLLAESLEVVQQTAAVILAALEPPTAEQAAMRDAELAQVA